MGIILRNVNVSDFVRLSLKGFGAGFSSMPMILKFNTEGNTVGNRTITLPIGGSGTNVTIDWGDGTKETSLYTGTTGGVTHEYATPGVYDVKLTGYIRQFNYGSYKEDRVLVDVVQWG